MQPKNISDHRPALRPPQFTVRTLAVLVALICIYLALFQSLGPIGKFALTLTSLMGLAHVAGNAVGTRLRSNGNDSSFALKESEHASPAVSTAPATAHPGSFAPATSLSRRNSLGRNVYWVTLMGALCGFFGGGALLTLINGQASIASIVFGASSAAILGAMSGFAVFCLCRVTFAAWREAQKDIITTQSPGLLAWLSTSRRKTDQIPAKLANDVPSN